MDEILVKGTDGKWYLLKGEELLPYDEHGAWSMEHGAKRIELPKGVSEERYERLEKTEDRRQKTEIVGAIRPPSSVRRPPSSHAEHPVAKELDELVDRVIKNVELRMQNVEGLKDAVLQKRFRTIVSARLRDVRDSAETLSMLTRDQKVGGMGFSMEHGAWSMEQIEKAFQEFQRKWKEAEARRAEEWKKKQRQQLQQRQQEQKREETELEERYKKLVGVKIREVSDRPAGGDSAIQGSSFAPTASRVGAADAPKIAPPHRQAVPQPASSAGRGGMEKREGKVTDIRSVPKLVGPLEELSGLTLEDFRRLGRVAPATAKIKDKIEYVGRASPARRAEAVKAWMSSPVARLYREATVAALERGRPVPEVMTQWKGEGKPTLTDEEFNGIMELNQKLRL